MVNGAGHVGQQVWVAVCVAAHEGTDLDAAGGFRPGTQHGPAFKNLAVRVTVEWEEVVIVENDVHADIFGFLGSAADRVIVGMLQL